MTRRQMMGFCGGLAAARTHFGAEPRREEIRLGVCTYSFHSFQRRLAISMMKQLGAPYVSVKEFHLPYCITPQEASRARNDFQRAGLTIVSGGVIPLADEEPAALKRYFEYARGCGMPMIIAAPTHSALGAVEKLAQEFDIRVAIHNHGPEDEEFPTAKSVLEAVKGRDARLGLCLDLGHSLRSGAEVVQELAVAGTRLLDVHIKDLRSASEKKSQCDVGEGIMPVVAIFQQLKKMAYGGCVNLEYEINGDNPLPGMLHSFGYMRGVLAGLAG